MLLTVTLAVMAVSSLNVAVDLRSRQVTGATIFLIVSVLFVNVGMLVDWLGVSGASKAWADTALLVSTMGCLTFLVGKVIGQAIPVAKSQTTEGGPGRFRQQMSISEWAHQREGYVGVLFASAVLVVIAALYFILLGSIPLLSGLSDLAHTGTISNGLVSRYRNARDSYAGGAGYIPGQGLLESVRYWGVPLVVIWCWELRRRRYRRAVTLGFIATATLLLIATGQRWPLMYLFVALLVVGVTERNWAVGRIGRLVLFATFCGVALSVVLGRGAQGINSVAKAIGFGVNALVSRLFLQQTQVPFASFGFSRRELLPNGGLTWLQDLAAFAPGPGASYTVDFSNIVTGVAGGFTAPPDFFTEAWINGGWGMVVCASFVWGLVTSRARMPRTDSHLISVGFRSVFITVLGFSAVAGLAQSLSAVIVFAIAWLSIQSYRFAVIGRGRRFLRPARATAMMASCKS